MLKRLNKLTSVPKTKLELNLCINREYIMNKEQQQQKNEWTKIKEKQVLF